MRTIEQNREYQRKWRAAHLEQARESNRNSRRNHPEQERAYFRSHSKQQRLKAIKFLGKVCIRCGFSDERALQFDHKIAILRSRNRPFSTYQIASQILKGSKDFQLLCANCNWIKRMENREHHPRLDTGDKMEE